MSLDHALRFRPIFRRYLWGGRRLQAVLNKPLGPGDDYAESWEIVDHGADQSVVEYGPCHGLTLHQLVQNHAQELFGEVPITERFPLLLKFLDAKADLSLQVHPTDQQAARLDPPDLGKTEAWVILHADAGSVLYAGLRPGVDRSAVEQAIAEGSLEQCLHRIEPEVGDCIFVPAGTPHAIGAGLLVAELQQSSDTTFRLFDWNRVGPDGKPRTLHVEQGLEAIDFQRGAVEPNKGTPTGREFVSRLVACNKFVIDRWQLAGPHFIAGNGRFHLLAVTAGAIEIEGDLSRLPLALGQTALIPASAGALEIRPIGKRAELLDMYLP
jgi:mannose-6-phosphate isomerase